ncbi:MAG TPA: hypothetical protein PKX48_10930 [Planctomycetota bacterium]|nr:hypothetical protein [Planctomycetota bacterium]HOE87651.1 hypothetical protein [Planctomycetota bacterium]HOR68030.1 hypothetical protein [Planctomycetota bacterium]HPL61169.1 hypothetical protein [Planctomycetota bacterium]HPY70180.1 hypothetical protein [Planctomycetota bacterium]
MIGKRTEQPSPSALVETMPFSPEFLANGGEQVLAGRERENARVDHRFHNMLLSTEHLLQMETALQLLEGQFDAPAFAIEYTNVGTGDLVDGEVRDVDVIPSRLLVETRDKAETLTIGRPNAAIDTSPERSLDLQVIERLNSPLGYRISF